MDKKLERLVRKVAILAQQRYATIGYMAPLFYGIRDNGSRFIFDPDALGLIEGDYDRQTKDAVVNCVQMLFALHHIRQYVYASEAWMVATSFGTTQKEILELAKDQVSISKHPKRVEVLIFEAEDMEGNRISGRQSIIRPAGQKPYLDDDLELEDATEWDTTGRFTHLLAFRKFYDKRRSE